MSARPSSDPSGDDTASNKAAGAAPSMMAEQAVLGGLMLLRTMPDRVAELAYRCRLLPPRPPATTAIRELAERTSRSTRRPPRRAVRFAGEWSPVGGFHRVELAGTTRARQHRSCRDVRDSADRRVGTGIVNDGFQPKAARSPPELLAKAEQKLRHRRGRCARQAGPPRCARRRSKPSTCCRPATPMAAAVTVASAQRPAPEFDESDRRPAAHPTRWSPPRARRMGGDHRWCAKHRRNTPR